MSETKLCLGTVQFGLDYGINNFAGKPSKEKSFAMLDEALKQGVSVIDTATAYGNAEELLGEFGISKHKVKVISKLKPNLITAACSNPEEVVEQEVRGSLDRTGLCELDGYLLHTPENFYNKRILEGLRRCKEQGLIRHFGVSIYETEHALDVVKSGEVDYIQIPYSIFDQRVDRTDFFNIAKQKGVTVYARSAFLQGLILMEEDKIPNNLRMTKGYLRDFDRIISKYGFTRAEAAFLFSYSHPNIDYIVFGVDTLQHLKDDIVFSKNEVDFDPCREELKHSFVNISRSIIFPSLWKRKEGAS